VDAVFERYTKEQQGKNLLCWLLGQFTATILIIMGFLYF